MSDRLMTPEERLQVLEQLEARRRRTARRVAWSAWGGVLIAAAVFAVVIAAGRRELAVVAHKTAEKQEELRRTEERLDQVNKQLKTTAALFGQVSESARRRAVTDQLAATPASAATLPRIYMHVVDPEDRLRARRLEHALAAAGYVVLGIEYVRNVRLSTSDVRFYREAESTEAQRIAKVLTEQGVPGVRVNWLRQFADRDNIKQNHFEVWLAHGF